MSEDLGRVEVVIIGGGPAGSTLACLLAASHHPVEIVESADAPADRVGELLAPSINAVLHRIGLLEAVDARFARRDGLGWTGPRTPGGTILKIPVGTYPPPRALRPYGFNVERRCFDAMLLQQARDLGARVQQAMVRRVVFDNARATAVEVRRADGTIERLTGRFIIDASGRRCLLGAQLSLVRSQAARRQCAAYTWFRHVDALGTPRTYAVLHTLRHWGAWAWQIPLRDDVTSVGIVMPCDRLRASGVSRDSTLSAIIQQNDALSRALSGASRLGPWRTTGDYAYTLQRLWGSGWLAVGDACGFVDPIFASGVDVAMYSAVFAYEAVLPLLMLGRWTASDEAFALSKYEERVRQGMSIWAEAVELFYSAPAALRRLACDASNLRAVCRFLQGNPYEMQNVAIARGLFDRAWPSAEPSVSRPE